MISSNRRHTRVLKNVRDVAAWRLCLGCGACAYGCPYGNVDLIDVIDQGIRPVINTAGCRACGKCLEYCPGAATIQHEDILFDKQWGRLVEVWEGFASDPDIRFKGSSGGLCTALSIFALESGRAEGVLHIGADNEIPWKNATYFSRQKEEVLSNAGSRYSPASPCDGLSAIKSSKRMAVFIGKPCDVAGYKMAEKADPDLKLKTSLTIGFFCAGTPSTQGTLDLLQRCNIELEKLKKMRYRGMGWPGMAAISFKNPSIPSIELTYKDSWGFVQKYRPFRCYLCPDLTAELADISVGDAWYREFGNNDPGRSLILIRTERGREFFREALQRRYVSAELSKRDIINLSQKNLLSKRQAIWGRLLAMRLLGIPSPRLDGYQLRENWMDLSFKDKIKSVLGTARRIFKRKYFYPIRFECKNGTWRTTMNK
jgi:coenzyme F420 hydrogenase subunit beta